jgi:preprotein translocase subunit Sec63
MSFQKGGGSSRKFKKMKRGKLQQACRILVSPVNGTVSFQAPFNEDFNKEFLAAVDHKRRMWDKERKVWRTLPELLTTVVEIAQRHFSKIEGLEAIYQNDYDVIGVSDDMPLKAIEAVVKALRIVYAPDHAPAGQKDEYTDKIQEIADAWGRIQQERGE